MLPETSLVCKLPCLLKPLTIWGWSSSFLTLREGTISDVTKEALKFAKQKLGQETPAAAKSLQLCPTLRPHRWQSTRPRRPWDSPGKNTGVRCHFILQCMKVKSESDRVRFLATPWTAAYQSPPSMVFSRQEYWSGLPLPSLRSRNLLQE